VILDSSAIVEVVLEDPAAEAVARRIAAEREVGVGAPTLVETTMVVTTKVGPTGRLLVRAFLQRVNGIVVPFGDAHWTVAVDAFVRFGKGRHPARLNFGDCLTYATAQLAGQPLLALGDDFAQTDLELASVDM
jgi:ribonuclease VapC